MLKHSDLISLPYTPDLTEAGIAYACRSLAHTYDRMGGSQITRLRRIVAGKAVELAFRRYLYNQEVPFDNFGATPFTDPDHYDVALGGRRCDVKSFLIFDKATIRKLRRDPEYLLQAAALVPADQLGSNHLRESDLYIFAFASALLTHDRNDVQRALAAGQPVFLIHPFAQSWAYPTRWVSLGRLLLTSDAPEALSIELGGQTQDRSFQTERMQLPPQGASVCQTDFFSLAYIHFDQRPSGRVRLYSPARKVSEIIASHSLGNIWVYGMGIVLAGYSPVGEFRRLSRYLPAGSRVLQYPQTRTANYTLSLADLHPLTGLLAQARAWDLYQKQRR